MVILMRWYIYVGKEIYEYKSSSWDLFKYYSIIISTTANKDVEFMQLVKQLISQGYIN